MASKDDYVPPAVKEKKKTKGGKMGNATATAEGAGGGNGTESAAATADASSSIAEEWSQEQQVREGRTIPCNPCKS